MSNMDDLVRADFWASMAFNPDASDEELRHWFKEFSLRADKMLLDDWKNHNDGRMAEVKQIMYEVIYEKEHPPVKKMLKIDAERDSVCMQDDCMAPHCKQLECEEDLLLSRFMYELIGYVPSAGDNTVWDIYSNATADNHRKATKIATIFLGKGSFNYELHVEDRPLKDMILQKVYCALMRKA
ncbi:hypothetical protein [Butyrivibrio sp. MC2021]|uniref:hypothetical protein n=1 Tax=Butyrivibrio sp. MC2021 TaxID=1408306 RepID=UPI00055FD872|nr:hypothetical protein [Butyrivibrio sp. MC2021]